MNLIEIGIYKFENVARPCHCFQDYISDTVKFLLWGTMKDKVYMQNNTCAEIK